MDDLYRHLLELKRWAKYGKLIGGVIHNLNTPLMGVSGRVELISMMHPDVKGTSQIIEQTDRINQMLTDLGRMYDADKNPQPEMIELSRYIEMIDNFLNADMEYKHKMQREFKLAPGIRAKIIPQALLNTFCEIVANTMEAPLEQDTRTFTCTLERQDDSALLKITNNTRAIADEILANIGKPQVSDKPGHIGMGLWACQNWLSQNDCTLQVANTDAGVCYCISIPIEPQHKDA